MAHPPRLADAFWDLRDHAYDHPALWDEVKAEELFQQLAEFVEAEAPAGEPAEWHAVAERMFDWRSSATGR